ncbi:hypothetical protein [Stieleria varia]|uniref:Tetratricopeptide repeat protein n=1 Tax=Stieleria varia TaxID=2528005 RepID=A0A5C5ZZ46_9BACT|nr:hypothetical protein [Stieleria varia]TWT92385.1 hypothetical protein Pla52n_62590 [Stieleria varia]
MNISRVLLSFVIATSALATANAQVVQLPTFHQFSYNGSVLVPDGGTTSLGGVSRSAIGSSHRPGSRALGATLSRSNASVTVTIIDHDEIDRQIRGVTADRPNGFPVDPAAAKVVDQDAEGKALVRYARAKYRSGDQSAAFEGYRMAIAVLSPNLRQLAEAEFKRQFGSAATQALSMR